METGKFRELSKKRRGIVSVEVDNPGRKRYVNFYRRGTGRHGADRSEVPEVQQMKEWKEQMENRKEIFVDGIGQIHFTGGMVRFDFVTLQPKEGENPVPEVAQRVIMPPQGFLNAFGSMQQLIDKLVEAGVLQKNENAAK